jgi:hypothetical protein
VAMLRGIELLMTFFRRLVTMYREARPDWPKIKSFAALAADDADVAVNRQPHPHDAGVSAAAVRRGALPARPGAGVLWAATRRQYRRIMSSNWEGLITQTTAMQMRESERT